MIVVDITNAPVGRAQINCAIICRFSAPRLVMDLSVPLSLSLSSLISLRDDQRDGAVDCTETARRATTRKIKHE